MRLQTRPSSPWGGQGFVCSPAWAPDRSEARAGRNGGARGCAAPRSLPPPTHCSVTSRRCGAGPLGNGGTDFEARNEGAPTLGSVSCAPTSQARTRPVTARPTARRPPPRAWGSIGLHRGLRRKGGTVGRKDSGHSASWTVALDRRGAAARASGSRAWSVVVPALGTALCEPGEVGPRAGAGGGRRWVPLSSFHSVATLPSPSSPSVPGRELAASYWKSSEAALLLSLVTLPCSRGPAKGTFPRVSTEKCTGPVPF